MKFYHLVLIVGLVALVAPKAAWGFVAFTAVAAVALWLLVLSGAGKKRGAPKG